MTVLDMHIMSRWCVVLAWIVEGGGVDTIVGLWACSLWDWRSTGITWSACRLGGCCKRVRVKLSAIECSIDDGREWQ